MFFKFKKVESLCDFCKNEIETLGHLFFYCDKVRCFGGELEDFLSTIKIFTIRFEIRDVLFEFYSYLMEVFF